MAEKAVGRRRMSRRRRSESFQGIHDLGCRETVHKMLRDGISPTIVAKYIQSQNELTQLKEASLTRQLYRYRKTLPLAETIPKPHVTRLLERARKSLDELQVLDAAIRLGMERVERAVYWERLITSRKKKGEPPCLLKGVDTALKTIVDAVKAKVLVKSELGIPELEAEVFMGQLFKTLLRHLGPSQARPIMQAIDEEVIKPGFKNGLLNLRREEARTSSPEWRRWRPATSQNDKVN